MILFRHLMREKNYNILVLITVKHSLKFNMLQDYDIKEHNNLIKYIDLHKLFLNSDTISL